MNFRPVTYSLRSTLPYLAPGLFLLVLPITHTVTMRLLMLLITLVMASVAFSRGDRSRPPCLVMWTLWLGVALFSLTTAVDPGYSAGEIKTEIGYGIIAFFSFYVLTRRWQHYVALTSVTLAGVWILSSAALFNGLMGNSWQKDSFYGGVGYFSTYLITLLPMLLLLVYHQHKKKPILTKAVSALTALLFLLAAYLTMNLMFWICFFIQLLALLLLVFRGLSRLKLAILLISTVLAVSGLVTVGSQKSRITSFTPQGFAHMFVSDPRIKHWSIVVEIIGQQPFRGDGFGRNALTKAHPEVLKKMGLRHSHNIFLDAAVQMGLEGALVLALLFGCLGWHFNRLRREQDRDLNMIGIVGLILLAGVISKSMTDNFFLRHLSLMFWAEVGMLLGLARGILLQRATEQSPQTP